MGQGASKLTERDFRPPRGPSVDTLVPVRKKCGEAPREWNVHALAWKKGKLCLKDGNTLATPTSCVGNTNKLRNNAGLGPPQAAARQDDHLQASWGKVAAAQGSKRSRTPHSSKPLKCFSSQEVREKFVKQGTWQVKVQRVSVHEVSPSLSDTVSLSGEWEFPPARAGSPVGRHFAGGQLQGSKVWRQTRMTSTEHGPNMKVTSSPCLQWRQSGQNCSVGDEGPLNTKWNRTLSQWKSCNCLDHCSKERATDPLQPL